MTSSMFPVSKDEVPDREIVQTRNLKVGDRLWSGNTILGWRYMGEVTDLTKTGKGMTRVQVAGVDFGPAGARREWQVEVPR